MTPARRLLATSMLTLTLATLAQTPSPGPANAYEQRAAEALTRERARSQAHLCEHTADPSDYTVGNCYVRESHTTDANYTAYIRALGALLRQRLATASPHPQPAAPPQRIPLDDAEATWLTYRKQSCLAMTDQYAGGTLGRVAYPRCLVTSTWTHMNDLSVLYSDL